MSDRLDPEQLSELLDLPDDDPRRRAAEADPRLQARLRAYREFVSPLDVPEGAQMKTAEDHLGRMLERELGVTLAPEPGGVGTPPVPGPSGATSTRRRVSSGGTSQRSAVASPRRTGHAPGPRQQTAARPSTWASGR